MCGYIPVAHSMHCYLTSVDVHSEVKHQSVSQFVIYHLAWVDQTQELGGGMGRGRKGREEEGQSLVCYLCDTTRS